MSSIYAHRQNSPYTAMRARAHGTLLVVQPYRGALHSGDPLTIDMDRGVIAVSEERINMDADYLTVYGILAVLQLPSFVAVAAITAAEKVAVVNGSSFYRVSAVRVFTSRDTAPKAAADARMLALFKYACDPNGAGRGIYFSPDCNATVTQQYAYNNPVDEDTPLWKQSNGDFWWNDELTKPLRQVRGADKYVLPCILGFVRQLVDHPVYYQAKQEMVTVTLVARRYKRRPGCRHWRRGVDMKGDVANFVETEQITELSSQVRCAYVQTRGSIPLCWSQVPNIKYKPPTEIADPATNREPFRKHAQKMVTTYGPVIGINLVNQSGSEGRLYKEYERLVTGIAGDPDFTLKSFDFHKECGQLDYSNLKKLWASLAPKFEEWGMFMAHANDNPLNARGADDGEHVTQAQKGVLRTNCIDCLDRTNVVQANFARKALEATLRHAKLMTPSALEDIQSQFPKLHQQFNVMWADHGDMLSRQYAGTGALKSGFTRTGHRSYGGMLDDGLKSVVRYYLNNFEDGHKQDALDLFAGSFQLDEAMTTVAQKQASGAIPMLAGTACVLLALQLAIAAPWNDRIHFSTTVLIPAVLAVLLFLLVAALGQRACCRPHLCPSATQVWLPTKL